MTEDQTTLVTDVVQATGLSDRQVRGAVELFSDGATIPFIARYRKERTGALDERGLRAVEDQLNYFRDLNSRRDSILKSLLEQGMLDDALRARVLSTRDRKELEDIYLPFRPKRKTRATVARARGLEPLATYLAAQEDTKSRDELLADFIHPSRDVPDAETALKGASDILAEHWADNTEIRQWLRPVVRKGFLVSKVRRAFKDKPSKFEMYYDYREPLARMPSHRYLAVRRGESEEVLSVKIEVEEDSTKTRLMGEIIKNPSFAFRDVLVEAASDCYSRLLFPSVESEVLLENRETADESAIEVFSKNLRDLLLAPPAGNRVVLGIDPGFRTGCKVAVVDATGKFVDNTTIYPTPPRNQIEGAAEKLAKLIKKHDVDIIAIGNGTASRETDAFVAGFLKSSYADKNREIGKIIVSESGASIYSASEIAAEEFPDLDLTVRGAISIARRLQDPLAELVKIDARSIGVGQYQHDVNQARLRTALDREVESCVNSVGVDVNTASARLLSYVAGIGPKLAEAIVERRDTKGPFQSRKEVLDVPRLGARAFEQCAGFLRIRDGKQPLHNSAVHPESYPIVERMAKSTNASTRELVGNATLVRQLKAADYVSDEVGLPTVEDILSELEKPGRDPRKEFRMPSFADAVTEITDLKPGMTLEGVVTNVTNFGAFVDVGVHQDGLVHISEIADRFVKDPADEVSVGDVVRVKVLSVEVERKRIALTRKV